ncbi:MAG: indole-3-glycerol-phosphate synthase [Candidatus Eisenbacteria sp.]|nr:indole-3-glycerol-phosphate synthase [Candidatus Eisenbacteria bacterium]
MTFLDRVIREKRREVAAGRRTRRVNDLECRASERPTRDFLRAISGGCKVIAEIKGKSPAAPVFRHSGDVERLAAIYESNGASAISIVTDERNFGTCLRDVDRIRRVSSLPVLVKDFVIDAHQVMEARAAGADAILLIARILQEDLFASMFDLAGRLGMSVLVECHHEEDVAKAAAVGALIVGINNRDLRTLNVSLETTRNLVSRVPEEALCVSESGIVAREEIELLASLGVDAFLIGSALLNSAEPDRTLRRLTGLEPERSGGEAA